MREEIIKVYKFHELSAHAKMRAFNQWTDGLEQSEKYYCYGDISGTITKIKTQQVEFLVDGTIWRPR